MKPKDAKEFMVLLGDYIMYRIDMYHNAENANHAEYQEAYQNSERMRNKIIERLSD